MYRAPTLLQLFSRGYIVRLFMLLLLLSVPLIADGFLLLLLAERCGRYLALAICASTGFFGLFFLINSVSTTLHTLRIRVSQGEYPRRQYHDVAALLIAALLLIIPGFFTDLIGLLFYLPPLRSALGFAVCRPWRRQLSEVYEHLRMEST
ncbi:MAG: FxsA family protein [Spirochaetaceae bacterium]|nr:MAG: FxsA family protein [Spirochaetaceae bacterium]